MRVSGVVNLKINQVNYFKTCLSVKSVWDVI